MSYTMSLRVTEGWRTVVAEWRCLVGRRWDLGKRAPRQIPTASIVVSILLALYATAAGAAIPASERQVLLNLYTSTNGGSWTNKTNWNGTAGTECTWYGVTCEHLGEGDDTVVDIALTGNHLTGNLPTLAGLTNLQYFQVFDNQLTGSIPTLAGLTNLQEFWAQNNQLTGSIPALAGLTNLQYFNVAGNQLTGSIPAFTRLTLVYFDASANRLTGSIPALSGPTNLHTFRVGFNQLTGSIPALSGLTNLYDFSVSNNQLTGSIPALSGLTNLSFFQVAGNQLTGSIPALTGLTNLQYFVVAGNQLTGNVPAVPSPSALVVGQSRLCPNYLNHTADPAWDAATGVSPWYANCAAAPSVITTAATNVTATSVILNGTVSSNGASTTVSFQYGLTASYGSFVTAAQSPLAAGATNAAVSAGIAQLACNTLYHFRAVGANGAGTTNGADATFTTAACINFPLTPPSGCTVSASPTSLPAGGGTVALTVSCAGGGAPTSYGWSASPSVTYTGGGATNSAVITQTTAFTVVASNAAGSSSPVTASIQVATPSSPPSGCTASATPTSLPSAGGTVQLNASCTSPSSGITYSWSKNSAPFSTAQNPTDTLPANAATTAVTYAYQATACLAAFPQTCTVIAPVSVTVAAAPVLGTPSACSISATPIALPAGGGSVALGVSCAAGGAPTSYTWTASPSVTYTSGGTTTVPTNGAAITQPTTFTVVASNAAGGSTAASVTVAVGAPPASTLKPTAEQLVRFADAAYGNARSVAGYSEIAVAVTPSPGFSVKAFRSTAGDRIVVAIAGTNEPFALLGADPPFQGAQPSQALRDYVTYATSVVRSLASSYPGVELTFTGHSLGGTIAQVLAKASGANAITFNAPGAAQLMPALQSSLSGLPTLPQPSGGQELTHYRLYGDLVSTVGTPLGTTFTLTPPAPLSTSLIDAAPLEYAKAMHLLSTVEQRLSASTTASFGPTAANAQGLLATEAAQGGEMEFAPVAVTATGSYFIDPQGVDLYTLLSDPGSPRFKSIKFPFLLNTDAVFRLERGVNGVWTAVGTFDEQATHDLGTQGADQLRFFVLERNSQRPPLSVEPFVFGVKFASAGTLAGTLKAEASVPNYQGMWYAAPAESEAGWGINFAHQGDAIFATWFTHDADGRAWNLSMSAFQTGPNTFAGTLVVVTGPPFGTVPFDLTQVHETPVGNGTLTFTDANNGTFTYTVNGTTQTKSITKQLFGVAPTCTWNGPVSLAAATNYQDMWWALGGLESGWGINFAHQGNAIFATWFTFDLAGNPLPMSATLFRVGTSNAYRGTLIRTGGPPFSAPTWNPTTVIRTELGTATVTFANGNRATFSYTVALNGPTSAVTQSKTIERQVFRGSGTTCQ